MIVISLKKHWLGRLQMDSFTIRCQIGLEINSFFKIILILSKSSLTGFLIVLAMLWCVARHYQGGGFTLLESCWGCCWSRYDAKPEISEENSASLMTSLDASRMYDLKANKNLPIMYHFCCVIMIDLKLDHNIKK